MNEYGSNISAAEAAELLRKAERPVVLTHAKPDGDAYGAVVALTAALRLLGKRPAAALVPPVPASFAELAGSDIPRTHRKGETLPEGDLVVVLDTGAWAQLSPLDEPLRGMVGRMLIIDHHESGDVPAAWRYVDSKASACCEVLAQVLDLLGSADADRLYDPVVSEALFVGIASDTGWFRFSNTRPATYELAARLLRKGVDQSEVYRKLEQSERPEKLALMIRALDSLQLLAGGRAALMVLRAADFAETGALLEETERLVDVPRAVASVQVVALVTQSPGADGDLIRISFRSKPGPGAVNVATLAERFGGGGHARAAGAKVKMPLDEAVKRVAEALVGKFE